MSDWLCAALVLAYEFALARKARNDDALAASAFAANCSSQEHMNWPLNWAFQHAMAPV